MQFHNSITNRIGGTKNFTSHVISDLDCGLITASFAWQNQGRTGHPSMRTSDMRMFEAGRCRTADREGVDGRWTRGGGGGRGGKTQKGDDGKVGEHRVGGENQAVVQRMASISWTAMLISNYKWQTTLDHPQNFSPLFRIAHVM